MGELFDYEQPQPYIVRGTEYDDSFPTPVLTAGQSFVLGYTNEKQGIKMASPEHPVIIFDDFTTSSHFVDFPFKVKSSAMKLLTLRDKNEDIHFAYQVLQNIAYTPVSHERHWISKFATFATLMPECKSEMQAIGHFMSNLDGLITLHQRKYDKLVIFKKSMLEKMFPKDGESVPEIRFAGFTDPWEQRKLGELFDYEQPQPYIVRGTEYDDSFPTPVLTAGQSFVLGYTNEKQGIKMASPEHPVIIFDDFTTSSHFVDFPFKVKSSAMKLLTLRDKNEDIHFAYQVLQNIAYTPVSHERHWISKFATFATLMPECKSEMQAIGHFMSNLDGLITLHQRKYDKLVIFKKSMLEKMFPKDGESVPEIRFAGFTDPWEQRKLGDVASSFDYGLNAAATEYDGQNKYLRITDIDDETHEFSKSDLTTPLADLAMSADYLLKEGDLLFARTGASVGKTYLYRQFDGMVYFAGFLIRARIGEGADPEFAYQATLTDAYKKYVAITSQRSGQPGVNAQEYADYQLMLPSKTEQQQIGMTLRSLDDLITLHQRKLELLQDIKKSLLDKMFV